MMNRFQALLSTSNFNFNELRCPYPEDPHTPYEGFWWSHCGWLLDNDATIKRVGDRSNAKELADQPFYQFLEKTYIWHVMAWAAAFFAIGGRALPYVPSLVLLEP